MFRPQPAYWFDLVVPQNRLAAAMEMLANTQVVELEALSSDETQTIDLSGLRGGLEEYGVLARRYRTYWPEPKANEQLPLVPFSQTLEETLQHFRAWVEAARPDIGSLQCAERQIASLKHLRELAAVAGKNFPTMLLSPTPSTLFDLNVYLLHDGGIVQNVSDNVATWTYKTPNGVYLIVLCLKVSTQKIENELSGLKARHIDVSEIIDSISSNQMRGVEGSLETDLLGTINAYIDAQNHRREEALALIQSHSERYDIAKARAHIERLRWLVVHVRRTKNTSYCTRITGWSTVAEAELKKEIEKLDVGYALMVEAPPQDREPPMVLSNPPWAHAFEVFVKLLGMPASEEVDPTPVVAVIAPLLFGYMFGDVGQGFVILLAGLYLRRRWPAAGILVPGGLYAMAFGVAFGSIFAREDIIPALWLHPLADPLPVLAVALSFGVTILLTGMVLNAAAARWRGMERSWWLTSAGLFPAYLGLLISVFDINGMWLSGIGIVWVAVGSTIMAVRKEHASVFIAFAQSLAILVEQLFQLLINTLSFVRVGAFAIAHAGLASALMVLADITEGAIGFWLVMILGNIFIIVLEGLVAGIQTTRLMLFEFFIRFLKAEGRPLRVLPTPQQWSRKSERKSS